MPVAARASERIVVIDPGHGGEDGGAVAADGTLEKDLNLEIALRLRDLLDLFGVENVMTRETDISIHSPEAETLREMKSSDLKNRVALVNSMGNALLVSIHQNFFTDARYHGAQVFFSSDDPEGAALAVFTQACLCRALDPENSRAAAVISESVYLMKNKTCSGILVECGFLSNPAETDNLKDEIYQRNLAAAIAASLLNTKDERG